MRANRFNCYIEGCYRSYAKQKYLRNHIEAVHRPQKRYVCPECNKYFASNQNLREHSYTHTGEYPYVCPIPGCNQKFRQGSLYSSHKKIHRSGAEERPTFFELKLTQLLETASLQQQVSEVICSDDIEIILPSIRGSSQYPRFWHAWHSLGPKLSVKRLCVLVVYGR